VFKSTGVIPGYERKAIRTQLKATWITHRATPIRKNKNKKKTEKP